MIQRLTEILKDRFGLNDEHLSEAERVRTETGGAIGQILDAHGLEQVVLRQIFLIHQNLTDGSACLGSDALCFGQMLVI